MAPKTLDIEPLETRIGHRFTNRDLAALALTHISGASGRRESYQRLEFLGDRVLGLVVAELLYASFPEAEEGELSRRLADLVRRETCAEVAREWGVEAHLRLGEGERQASNKVTILSDVCESLIGAVFLDADYAAAKDVIVRAFEPLMRAPRRPLRDPKTALQEWAQARGLEAPLYREVGRAGPHHAPEFTISVTVTGFASAEAKGSSKRGAEQAAALQFLAREGIGQQ
ncbi:MAG TPA: ribonuclease III [Methylovirgula sp.]|nr:ribonuclease III [Methylovirgula sp.]